jgi:hypothetical protein
MLRKWYKHVIHANKGEDHRKWFLASPDNALKIVSDIGMDIIGPLLIHFDCY